MTFEEIDEAIALMGREPDLAPLLAPGVAALVFAADPLRLLWSSDRTGALASAIVIAPDGRIDPSLPAARRIEALARSEAPVTGKRFEKIRFETSTLAPLTTCALRRISMPDGSTALVLTFVDRIPQIRRPGRQAPPPQVEEQPEDAVSPAQAPREAESPVPSAPVRFLWECDTGGSITRISGDLASAVGASSAQIVGRRLADILDVTEPDALAFDPKDIVLELIARRETFSGRRIFWKAEGGFAVAVDFAGFPAPGAAGREGAYRGFGIARPDIRGDWAMLLPQPQDAAAEPEGEIASTEAVSTETASDEPIIPAPLATLVPEPVEGPAEGPVMEDASAQAQPQPSHESAEQEGVEQESGLQEEPAQEEPAEVAPARQENVQEESAQEEHAQDQHEQGVSAQALDAPAEPVAITASLGAGEFAEAARAHALQAETSAASQERYASGSVMLMAGLATRIGGRLGDAAPPLRIVDDATADDEAAAPESAPSDVQKADIGAHQPGDDETPGSPSEPISQADEASQPDAETGSAEEARAADGPRPAPLSVEERNAFREIAKALGARFAGDDPETGEAPAEEVNPGETAGEDGAQSATPARVGGRLGGGHTGGSAPVIIAAANDRTPDIRAVLDRLPAGVVVHRGEDALFVNRYLLDLLGYGDLAAFMEAGGLARLFQARPAALTEAAQESTAPLIIASRNGASVAVEIRLTTVDWLGYPASMLMLRKIAETDPVERLRALEADLAAREERLREQTAILDTATDGIVVLDQSGRILSLNRAAEALFGYDQREIAGEGLTQLLETESHVSALEYLAAMRDDGMRSVLNDGCEVLGRVRQGGAIPLFMTLGTVGEGLDRKFCAVLRDMTAFKQTENELVAARRTAEAASAQKSEFLARISHEVRTPLNAIIGFAEVMLDERFGPVGNERYRDYLTDIHASGEHVISLVNDLLDLAKIEAGRMELNFTPVLLNDLVNSGVAMMQPEAARERIVLRTSFADRLPPVLVDERAMRQIVINLLSNAVKFTDAGGQVIVSTARGNQGDVIFRVRDTGIGMNEGEIAAALEPFRQLATTRKAGGTGLGLPLTKALVEANQGSLRITSRKDEGTLAEVVFPPARVVAG